MSEAAGSEEDAITGRVVAMPRRIAIARVIHRRCRAKLPRCMYQ
jgi:hypothetical protein